MKISARITLQIQKLTRFRELLKAGLAAPGVPRIDKMFNTWAGIYSAWALRRFKAASQGDGTWAPLVMSTLLARRKDKVTARSFTEKGRGELLSKGLMSFYREEYKNAKNELMALETAASVTKTKVRWVKARAKARAQSAVRQAARGLGMGTMRTRRETVAMFQDKMGYASFASILDDTGTLIQALKVGSRGNVSKRDGPSMVFGIGGPDVHPVKPGSKAAASTIGKIAAYHQYGGTIPGRPPKREIVVTPPKGDPVYKEFQEEWNRTAAKLLQEA